MSINGTKSRVKPRVADEAPLALGYSNQIQNLIERRDALTRLVEREQTRLDQLLVQTWGVWLHEAPVGARSVVLPRGTLTPSS